MIQENHLSINHDNALDCFRKELHMITVRRLTDHNNYYHCVNGLNTKL